MLPGDKWYRWVACADDYHSSELIGEYLQEKADLTTIADIEAEVK